MPSVWGVMRNVRGREESRTIRRFSPLAPRKLESEEKDEKAIGRIVAVGGVEDQEFNMTCWSWVAN